MSYSPILSLYRAAAAGLGVFAGPYLRARARNGKEDPARLSERFGHAQEARPPGVLVWLHGASVGESGVAVELAEALGARDDRLSFLITTGTLTSAARVARRMPARTRHAFAPLDRADCVRRFLNHWRPDLGVFVESELWPNLILESQRAGVKLALVNARMSPGTIRRWKSWASAARRLSSAFALTLAADARTADALSALRGEAVESPGNLKLAADPPIVDLEARAVLEREIGARPVWVAASTHGGEDEIALAAHRDLRKDHPDALLIIAPRHPERGEEIAWLADGAPRRSLAQPIGDASVYIADTLGELGLFYAIAPAALVAGSLLPHLKGHNPAEAAKLGAAVVTGPHVESFQDVFDALFAAKAALRVSNAEDLASAIALLWRDDALRARLVAAANDVFAQGASALDVTADKLVALLPARAIAQAANASA
ncbi:MAG: 3-deoxy-D-manno-octulosonic acid transferase [Hyphomonadaceae bacterium]|nr:3-deoxy-D-manno-octulosonic acid transferase [Hyphomonadaceae bacterium]